MTQQTIEYFTGNTNIIVVPKNTTIDFGNAKLSFDKQEIKVDDLIDVYIKLKNYLNTFEGIYL